MKSTLTYEPIKVRTEYFIDTGSARFVAQTCRRLFRPKLEQVKKHFDDLLKRGVIRPSKSPWATYLVIVEKSYGSIRPCGDYRKTNELASSDQYPIPRIEDILLKFGTATIFSKLDLEKVFSQIVMYSEDIPKNSINDTFLDFLNGYECHSD